MTDFESLKASLIQAREAAALASAKTSDGGSCCMDDVRLFGVRWSARLRRTFEAAGVSARRSTWRGRSCVALSFGVDGQAAKLTAAAEAAQKVLAGRGWDALVNYVTD